MLSKMNAELKKQFAAVFAVGSVFLFSLFELFRLWKSLFFARPRAVRPLKPKQGGKLRCCSSML